MNFDSTQFVLIVTGSVAMLTLICLLTLIGCYTKVANGRALVRTGVGRPRASFNGMVVIPGLHRVDTVDMAPQRIEVRRMTSPWLRSQDEQNVAANIVFHVRPPTTTSELLQIVCDDDGAFRGLDQSLAAMEVKCQQAVHQVVTQAPFESLYHGTAGLKQQLRDELAAGHCDLQIDSVAIDHLALPAAVTPETKQVLPKNLNRTFAAI